MVKIRHVVVVVVLFILCMWALSNFLTLNSEIDERDLNNSTDINGTIGNLSGDIVSYNNGEGLNYSNPNQDKSISQYLGLAKE